MGHLKKSAGGHLLKSTGGHLVNDCEGCPGWGGGGCHDCDPPIPDDLYVTFAGLGGDWSDANGKHKMEWSHDLNPRWVANHCMWKCDIATPGWGYGLLRIWLEYHPLIVDPEWRVYVEAAVTAVYWPDESCMMEFDRVPPNDICDPTGEYAENELIHDCSYCPHIPETCTLSAGATCEVSLT